MKPIRTTSETLAMCDLSRAKRMEPSRRVDRLTREQQATFWRKVPILAEWVGSWRESRR